MNLKLRKKTFNRLKNFIYFVIMKKKERILFKMILKKKYLILFMLFIFMINLFNIQEVYASNYLEPQNINGKNCYNIYDVLNIKNGTSDNISDNLLGKGKSFYLNGKLLYVYERSIVYKINNSYKAIDETTYSTGNNKITLPNNKSIELNDSTIYFSKNDLEDLFSLEIEDKGIPYEKFKNKKNEKPYKGVSFGFLKEHITDLGYVYLNNNMYQYYEEDRLTNTINFKSDNEISIQYYIGENKDVLNLVLKAIFPYSYTTISNSLENNQQINSTYDGINIESSIHDGNYIELTLKY